MELSLTSKALNRLGIKTNAFKEYEAHETKKAYEASRRHDYLFESKEEALKKHPELKDVFNVEETSLLFYQKVLGQHSKSLNTAQRNQQRSKEAGILALSYLDDDKVVPSFSSEGRALEAEMIKLDELNQLKAGLKATFNRNSENSFELKSNYQKKYALFTNAYFKDEKKALQTYPELAPLTQIKKQARRYYKQWVLKEHIDACVNDCLERAIDDISKGLPVDTVLEVKHHAKSLNQTMIGLSTATPHKDKQPYEYHGIPLMKSLIGRNGLKTGLWPYDLNSQKEVERIEDFDKQLKHKQYETSFFSLSKEDVLERFSELEPVYQKYDAALFYFSQKTDKKTATLASSLLIEKDFEQIGENKHLLAVAEYSNDFLLDTLKRAESQIQMNTNSDIELNMEDDKKTVIELSQSLGTQYIESSNDSIIELQNIDKSALVILVDALETPVEDLLNDYFEAIDKGEYKRDELEFYLEEYFARHFVSDEDKEKLFNYLQEEEHLKPKNPELERKEAGNSQNQISIDNLHSTAPKMDISAMFETPCRAKKIEVEAQGHRWNLQDIEAGLNNNAAHIATTLLGEPVSQDKNQLRFGSNKGSLIVTVEGDNKGKWYDHQKGVGGKLINLIMHEKQYGFKEALDYAGEFLSLQPEPFMKQKIDTSDMKGLTEAQLKTLGYARYLADSSKPVKGTLAETYLKEHRGIDMAFESENIRFLKSVNEPDSQQNHPGLLLVGRTKEGAVSGVQVVYLDESGKKLACGTPKRSYGLIKGAGVPIQEGGNIIAVAEGAETALSIAKAYPEMTVFASLGSITNVSAIDFNAKGNTVLICSDNDINNPDTEEKVRVSANEFQQKGFNVLITKPQEGAKDFNDVLMERGVAGVQAELKQLKVFDQEKFSKTVEETISENKLRIKEHDKVKKRTSNLEMEF